MYPVGRFGENHYLCSPTGSVLGAACRAVRLLPDDKIIKSDSYAATLSEGL